MKKILILTLPLFFIIQMAVSAEVVSSPEPYDYNNGLLDDEYIISEINLSNGLYDNNLDTSAGNSVTGQYVEFKHPVHIQGLFLKKGRFVTNLKFHFLNVDNEIETLSLNFESPTFEHYYDWVDIENVLKIELEQPGTAYKWYEVDFFGSYDGSNIIIPEPPVVEDVKNITAESEPDRINLSWELPETDFFEHVNIYRKDLGENEQEPAGFNLLNTFNLTSNDDYNPIFETNGTYFNDLTVEENSSYEYKLTTEYQGLESEGVTVQAVTGISPAPPIEGGGGEQQDNGDYLVTWLNPREGQVRIFVDGQEYTVAEAEAGQHLIPGADMKYNALGEPLVSWQSIAPNGQEGAIQSPEGLENPVKVNDVVKEGVSLIYLVSSFLLLGLAFIFAPKVIKLIRQAFINRKEQGNRRERTRRPRRERQSRVSTRRERQIRVSERAGRA